MLYIKTILSCSEYKYLFHYKTECGVVQEKMTRANDFCDEWIKLMGVFCDVLILKISDDPLNAAGLVKTVFFTEVHAI